MGAFAEKMMLCLFIFLSSFIFAKILTIQNSSTDITLRFFFLFMLINAVVSEYVVSSASKTVSH